jgi:hypothetical protein
MVIAGEWHALENGRFWRMVGRLDSSGDYIGLTTGGGKCTRNTFEAGEEPFRKRVERVAGQSFHDLPLTRGRMKSQETFYSSICYPSTGNRPYPSHLLQSVGVHRPLGQQTVSLA